MRSRLHKNCLQKYKWKRKNKRAKSLLKTRSKSLEKTYLNEGINVNKMQVKSPENASVNTIKTQAKREQNTSEKALNWQVKSQP